MKKVKSALLLCFTLVVLLVQPVQGMKAAEAGSLEAAIAWGLEHSPSLLTLRQEVEQLQRELATIEAGLRWQLSLTGLNMAGAGRPVRARAGGTEEVSAGIWP